MTQSDRILANSPSTQSVAAGAYRFGEHRGLGISVIDFKVMPHDSNGLLIIENTFHAQGGWRDTCIMIRMNGFMHLKANL